MIKKILRDRNFRLGLIITSVMLAVIIIGAFKTPYDPNAMDGASKMQGPSMAHIFGTDNFGRDIFSRVIQGAGATCFRAVLRSEERRVGKECRSRWSPYH